jgi:hypothetical protein
MRGTEQRKNHRFELRLPIELIRLGTVTLGQQSETANLSSSGVLFVFEAQMPVGEPIEYQITLPGARLNCIGKVVRMEKAVRSKKKDRFQVAATLERYEFVRSGAGDFQPQIHADKR